jgi:hypothetical protein
MKSSGYSDFGYGQEYPFSPQRGSERFKRGRDYEGVPGTGLFSAADRLILTFRSLQKMNSMRTGL